MNASPVRVAVWSGPRNLSTALLRSWENRPDSYVTDEPLYAFYLKVHPVDHPGLEEIVAAGETDWRKVVAWLTGPVPGGKRIWYQKHMAHHLLPEMETDWVDALTNALLIREPREMLTSLLAVMPNPTLEDTGLPQQRVLFERVRGTTGRRPPVLDAREVLLDPEKILSRFCEAVGVPFTEAMLRWPPGPRDTDGVWAKFWYANVERSTGFATYKPKETPVPEDFKELLADCETIYKELFRHRLTA